MGTLQGGERRNAILRGEPITSCGLTFYPVLVSEYEIFKMCAEALTMRQSTFPVKYVSLDFVSAVAQMDLDATRSESSETSGAFARLIRLLFLSLRLEFNEDMLAQTVFFAMGDDGNPKLHHFTINQNGNCIDITPLQFSTEIRSVIAEQNGLELPDESENAELIASAREKAEFDDQAQKLNINFPDLIASVAHNSFVREKDVLEWTVREFESQRRAIDREKRYMMYGTAEMSGYVKFKNGNPAPSLYFDLLDDSLGTIGLSKLGQIFGENDPTQTNK